MACSDLIESQIRSCAKTSRFTGQICHELRSEEVLIRASLALVMATPSTTKHEAQEEDDERKHTYAPQETHDTFPSPVWYAPSLPH
jgi:hypothetical protein